MLAIDTNLIVRYLTGDHPRQSARAKALIDGNDVFVCTTVLLEAELGMAWKLHRMWGIPAEALIRPQPRSRRRSTTAVG